MSVVLDIVAIAAMGGVAIVACFVIAACLWLGALHVTARARVWRDRRIVRALLKLPEISDERRVPAPPPPRRAGTRR